MSEQSVSELARRWQLGLRRTSSGYSVYRKEDGEVLYPYRTLSEVRAWLDGYAAGFNDAMLPLGE